MYDKVNETGGVIREFETGSVRDSAEGKGRQDLIPIYPLLRLAQHYENGAKKYGDRNWEKGQPVNQYYCSAFRHLTSWMAGDNSEDHLSALSWNAFAMVHTIKEIEEGRLPLSLLDGLPEDIRTRIGDNIIEYARNHVELEDVPKYITPVAQVKDDNGIYLCDCNACTRAREGIDETLEARILDEDEREI